MAHKNVAKRAMLGSVSHYVVLHAAVPVVVVPQPQQHSAAGERGSARNGAVPSRG